MKITISRSQWQEIGRLAGWKDFDTYQRRYDNMTPEDEDEPELDEDGKEKENPCKNCRRRGVNCLGTDCPI